MLTLDTSVEKLNKVGKATAGKLKKLEIINILDLIEHFPFRYDDYSQTVKISQLIPGARVNVRGVVEFIHNKRSPRRRMIITEAIIKDETEQMKVIWFNQPFISKNLKVGDMVSLAGLVREDFVGPQMISPEYEKIRGGRPAHTAGLVPAYRLTANLTNKQIRFLIKSALDAILKPRDPLPEMIKKKYRLIDLSVAWRQIHFPESADALVRAKRRLQFEELFFIQLAVRRRKLEIENQTAEPIKFQERETKKFVANLPFKLTAAQKKASWEILRDMEKSRPMSRLLEGDVGSGKTVAAALAILNTALNKKQSALLAPTEILAGQHFETLTNLFQETGLKIGLFTRSSKIIKSGKAESEKEKITKQKMIDIIKNGAADIIVGTHAMIQEKVDFKNLALAVVDEQHRFGVEQRKALRRKSGRPEFFPHLLSMTATPIPRSLAQVIYGDLDLSIINELPAGRKKIQTFLVPENKRSGGYEFIKKQIEQGRQAFVVCPLISPSDKLGVKSVEEEHRKLSQQIFPNLKIACLHGRLPAAAKEKIMKNFLENKVNVLVSTSVVEVGVDVPNATIMLIEGAERFGLAQLHQFRGRVGRSSHQSYCLLFSESMDDRSRRRLEIFVKSNDGFKLAEADLKMRGPGEVYGVAQKGFPEFKIATLEDHVLIKETREAAAAIIEAGAEKHPELMEKVEAGAEWLAG